MRNLNLVILILASVFFTHLAQAEAPKKDSLEQSIKNTIVDIIEDNTVFTKSKNQKHFRGFLDIQSPRVTMVLCSDSRVQVDNFSDGAENDIFVARNIGNQFVTTQGSVEYGVKVLKTPVLIFIGHTHCGAIKAARGDMSQIPHAIRKELDTIDVKSAHDDNEGVVINVHYQVDKALADFKENVDAKSLAIIGAVYDFRNDYGYGFGQLIIVNLNGNKNAEEIRNSNYFDGIDHVTIGIQKVDKKE